MFTGVLVSGVAVLVSAWAAWVAPALSNKVVHPAMSLRTLDENSGVYV